MEYKGSETGVVVTEGVFLFLFFFFSVPVLSFRYICYISYPLKGSDLLLCGMEECARSCRIEYDEV